MLLAILLTGVWAMDQLTTVETGQLVPAPKPLAATETVNPDSFHPGRARMFVFIVDSLRDKTATNPELMPYLSAMRQRSLHAVVTSSRDAVTVSAIREMFTGRERFQAFGFLRDFITSPESVESLFTQLHSAKVPVAVYPPFAFEQFAHYIPNRDFDGGGDDRAQAQQNEWIREAMVSFREGKVDFAVGHVVYSDRVAHDGGVHSKAYRAAFRSVDQLIAELDQKIAPEDTLVVTGDHGHTETGRHSLGLDVPSFTVYRGPGFQPGLSLGTIPIAEHRWLMSWGMKLPLAGDYASSRHPEGLVSGAHARPAAFSKGASPSKRGRSKSNLWHIVLTVVWLTVGLLATLWFGLLWEVWLDPRRVKVGFWLAIALSLAMVVSPWSAVLALLVTVAVVFAEHRAGNRRALIGLGLGVLASAACFGWGTGMALVRDVVHYPSMSRMRGAALLLFVAMALAAYRFGAVRASWFVVGGVALFFYPTVYRYGAMPALVNMWLCWMIALIVEARSATGKGRYLLVVMSAALFALLQPFAFSDAGNFEHHSWHAWIDGLSPTGHQQWVAASLALKLFLFVPWRGHHALKVIGAVVAVGLHFVMWRFWVPSAGVWIAAVALLCVAAWLLPRRCERDTGDELRRMAGLAALMLLYSYTIRLPIHHYMWADFFLAALYLSALMAKRFSRSDEHRHHYAILALFGVIVGGWTTVTWTMHLFEWKVFYDWFSAAFMENHALMFMPIIGARYVVIVLAARMILRRGFAGAESYPRRMIYTGLGLKLVTLTLIIVGLGSQIPDSGVYLEAIQEGAILAVLSLGLL